MQSTRSIKRKRPCTTIHFTIPPLLPWMDFRDKTADLFHGQAQLYRFINLWMAPLCLKCAIELAIPDIIHKHGKPISLSQLVSALKIPPSKAAFVKGLMRLLTHNGLFAITKSNNNEEESEEASYDLTSASKLLVSGTDHCLSSMVQLNVSSALIDLYQNLGKWVRGKENTERGIMWCRVYEFLTQNPADLVAFQAGMASNFRFMKVAMKDLESVFDGLSSIVDVGGTGTTAKIICEALPKLKCIVLDLPEVVAKRFPGDNNLSFVGGNMLEFIPHADAVLIKWVLHDWGDDDCLKILKNAKEAISGNRKGGKVIIIDSVG